jgi:hypothetical protein
MTAPGRDQRPSLWLRQAETNDLRYGFSSHSQCQVEAADHKIDRLVYELYELPEEEIRIIEEEK